MDLQGGNQDELRRLQQLRLSQGRPLQTGPLQVTVAPERRLVTPSGSVIRRSENLRTEAPYKPKTQINWSSLLDQGGDFGQAIIDRVGGGIVRGAARVAPWTVRTAMPISNLPQFKGIFDRYNRGTEEFIQQYAENTQGGPTRLDPFAYNEQSAGGRAGRIVGTGIKAGVDLYGLGRVSGGAEKIVKGSKVVRNLDEGGRAARFISGAAQRTAGSLAGTGAQSLVEIGQGKEELNLPQNAAIGIGVDVLGSPIIGKVWKYAAAGPTAKLLAKTDDPNIVRTILKEGTELSDNQIDEIAETIATEKKATNIKNVIEDSASRVDVPTPEKPKSVNVQLDKDVIDLVNTKVITRPSTSLILGSDTYGDIDPAQVTKYLDDINNGRPISPVIVEEVDGKTFVIDGKHQLAALEMAGIKDVPTVTKKPQTSPQALEQAVEALPPSSNISQAPVAQAVPEGVPSTSADIAQADIGSFADRAAKEAQDMKDLYGKETLRQKIAKLWDPLSPLRKMDKARAKALGIRQVDLPKTQSAEALAQVSRNSKEMAAQALKETNTARVIQKYQNKGPASTEFNIYRVAMRDLEQRADGRPAIFREMDDNSLSRWVAEYEARNPEARQDLLDIAADIRAFQDYGAELVSPEDLARVRTKKDGTEFQFWTPIERATPEDTITPAIPGQNIGTIGRQKILQEQTGSDLPPDVTFDALTDYVETVYKQVNQAKVARTVTENVQAGLVPGARVIQTGDETARMTQIRQNINELRDVTKSLQKEKGKVQFRTAEARRNAKAAQKEVNNRVREILRNTVDDPDAQTAINSLNDQDLTELMRIFNEPDIKKTPNVQRIYERFVKKSEAHANLAQRLDDIKMDLESLDNAKKGLGRELVELRPDPTTGRQTILGIDENGNKFRVELPPEYASVLQGTDKETMNTLLRGMRVVQQPWREAYTGILNPPFQIAQATFNAIMAPILKGPKVFSPSSLKAAISAFNGNSVNQQMLREGGITIYGGNLQKLVKDTTADALASQADALTRLKWFSNPKRAWEQLSLAGGKLDQAARAAMAQVDYDNAIKRGLSEADAQAAAVYTYNNSLPNFGNAASLITQIDAVIPYFSAGQTGTRQITRAIKENPVGVGGRIATLGLALSGLTAYNLAKDEGEAFYADMENSGKKYVLDNNVIFVLPGARKDPKTGEWTGIVKIPLPPELRPLGGAVRATFSPTESGVPVKQYATSVFNFITGGTASNRSPALQTAYGVVTGKDPNTGQDIYDETMTPEERRSAAGKYVIGSFGLPGKVATKGIGEVPNAFVDRVYGAKGISEGGQYYKNEGEAIKQVGLNKNELDAYRSTIAPRSKDLAGNAIKDKTYYDSASKATTWLRYPKTFEVSKAMDAKNRAAGKPGDPLFDLPPDRLKIVLNMMANYSPGNFEEKAIKELNPWLEDFNKQRSAYFDKVVPAGKKSTTDPMGVTVPTPSDTVKQKMEQLKSITDKKERGKFYSENPDVTDFYKQTENYQRAKRSFLGLPQFDRYPTASPELQKLMDTYNALPKGEGAGGKSPTRSAWIKSNPGAWAQMTDHWSKVDMFKLQESGAKAVYEGIDMDEEGLKAIEGLAKNMGMNTKQFYGKYGNIDKKDAINLLKLLSKDQDYTFKGPNTKRKVQKVRYRTPKRVGKKAKVKLG